MLTEEQSMNEIRERAEKKEREEREKAERKKQREEKKATAAAKPKPVPRQPKYDGVRLRRPLSNITNTHTTSQNTCIDPYDFSPN
jgi:sRNA-binding protein